MLDCEVISRRHSAAPRLPRFQTTLQRIQLVGLLESVQQVELRRIVLQWCEEHSIVPPPDAALSLAAFLVTRSAAIRRCLAHTPGFGRVARLTVIRRKELATPFVLNVACRHMSSITRNASIGLLTRGALGAAWEGLWWANRVR